MVNCLRSRGFYAVTVATEPLERWIAVYLHESAQHTERYGKEYPTKFLDFVTRYPDCSLLHFYDGKGPMCADGNDVEVRIYDIVARFDEVVDLSGVRSGTFGARIRRLADWRSRRRRKNGVKTFTEMGRLNQERVLYEALRKKSSVQATDVHLC